MNEQRRFYADVRKSRIIVHLFEACVLVWPGEPIHLIMCVNSLWYNFFSIVHCALMMFLPQKLPTAHLACSNNVFAYMFQPILVMFVLCRTNSDLLFRSHSIFLQGNTKFKDKRKKKMMMWNYYYLFFYLSTSVLYWQWFQDILLNPHLTQSPFPCVFISY